VGSVGRALQLMRESVRRPVRSLLVVSVVSGLSLASANCSRLRPAPVLPPDSGWAGGLGGWADTTDVSQFEIRRAVTTVPSSPPGSARLVVIVSQGATSAGPIAWARIRIQAAGRVWQAETDSSGAVIFQSLPAGPVRIAVAAVGFEWSSRGAVVRPDVSDTAVVRLRKQQCI